MTPGVLLNRDHLQTDVNHPLTPTLTRSRPLARSPGDLRSATAEQIPFAASQAAQVSPSGGEGETVAATQHTRASVGKIARLPKSIREQLNRRLDDGEPASAIVPWLNELPPVKEILAARFAGAPINDRNLSNWRATGYERWLARQDKVGMMKNTAKYAGDMAEADGVKIARGAAAVASEKILEFLETPYEKTTPENLVKLANASARLCRSEQNHLRVKIAQERRRQQERHLLLMRDKHQRDRVAIAYDVIGDPHAQEIKAADCDYAEKIELLGHYLYGDLWKPRPFPPLPSEPQACAAEPPPQGFPSLLKPSQG